MRHHQSDKALAELEKAVTLDPGNARFAYVYAVAVADKNVTKAIGVLESVLQKHSGNMEILSALRYYYQQTGDSNKSKECEEKLKRVMQVQ